MDDTIRVVKVTNGNEFTIKERYDSVDYLFPPGKPVRVPLAVASHCFGYRPWYTDDRVAQTDGFEDAADANWQSMRNYCVKRQGWNTERLVKDGLDEKYFSNIEIESVVLHLVEQEEAPVKEKA